MTPADIEARLPRTEAGIGGHLDLTDDDDRAEMARLLHRMLFAAGVAADGHTEALPPPKPGTHESDLFPDFENMFLVIGEQNSAGQIRGGTYEYNAAAEWSRANA